MKLMREENKASDRIYRFVTIRIADFEGCAGHATGMTYITKRYHHQLFPRRARIAENGPLIRNMTNYSREIHKTILLFI